MISVEDALNRCLALVSPLGTETVPLRHAAGRRMTIHATARRDQPPFAASAMDGYAVQCDPVTGESFSVIGEAKAGRAFRGTISAHQAVRIFTGAPVPEGATRVIIQEDVTRTGDIIRIGTNLDDGTNIRPKGQDFSVGYSLSPRILRPKDLALLAAMNISEVTVSCRPIVALIATGDELVMPGEEPGPDQIIASSIFALAAMIEAAGGEARILPIAQDTEEELLAILSMTEGCSLIVTIGGVSVGDHDLVGRVAETMGMERSFYKIAMRPGKPLMAGRLHKLPMLGLPGNPVSSIVCGHLFLLPMLRAMLGEASVPPISRATLTVDLPANGPRAHYMRAKLNATGIAPFDRQDSALISILTEANALLIRPVLDGPVTAGTEVNYIEI
ncbi:MAG: molybdopterin molybdotransferase MoeA [Rhodobacteraceae bacterium]|nr:molybdopterin molybdotransferase MoeA [Paracoccaceae bacterium]